MVGKWKLSCFGLSRAIEGVRWPDFYSEISTSASFAQGWLPPRPSPSARPDAIDRSDCALFVDGAHSAVISTMTHVLEPLIVVHDDSEKCRSRAEKGFCISDFQMGPLLTVCLVAG